MHGPCGYLAARAALGDARGWARPGARFHGPYSAGSAPEPRRRPRSGALLRRLAVLRGHGDPGRLGDHVDQPPRPLERPPLARRAVAHLGQPLDPGLDQIEVAVGVERLPHVVDELPDDREAGPGVKT